MSTLAVFGDSYASLSLDAILARAGVEGVSVDSSLVDPSRTALAWLLEPGAQGEIQTLTNSLPAGAVWWVSIGGIDALNDTPRWQIRQILNQLIELWCYRGHRVYHLGYEWWPPISGVDARFEDFYDACKELETRCALYQFVEMRGVTDGELADMLHLTAENYQIRVEHAWDTCFRYAW
jgi:hypothetical protein